MTTTAICAHPECDTEFEPNRFGGNTSYCSPECGKDDHERRMARPVVTPAERPIYRKAPMTPDEFSGYLATERRRLDQQPAHPDDKHWRRDQIAARVAKGWTVGQMARYFGMSREQMQARIDWLARLEAA